MNWSYQEGWSGDVVDVIGFVSRYSGMNTRITAVVPAVELSKQEGLAPLRGESFWFYSF